MPEEITVLARFVEAVRREKLDDKLFGKDDAAGNIVEPGIFTYDQVKMLYFQNPDFGFYFMQLATSRLFHNLELAEQRLAGLSHSASTAVEDPAVQVPAAKA